MFKSGRIFKSSSAKRYQTIWISYIEETFENALTVVVVLGGSTNAVLHLLAMAKTANVEILL